METGKLIYLLRCHALITLCKNITKLWVHTEKYKVKIVTKCLRIYSTIFYEVTNYYNKSRWFCFFVLAKELKQIYNSEIITLVCVFDWNK